MCRVWILTALGIVSQASGLTPILVNVTGDGFVAQGGQYTAGATMVDLRGGLNFVNSHPADTYNITFDATFFTGVGLTINLNAPLPPIGIPVAGQTSFAPVVNI